MRDLGARQNRASAGATEETSGFVQPLTGGPRGAYGDSTGGTTGASAVLQRIWGAEKTGASGIETAAISTEEPHIAHGGSTVLVAWTPEWPTRTNAKSAA